MPVRPSRAINPSEAEFDSLVPPQRPLRAIHPESTAAFSQPAQDLSGIDLTIQDSYNEFAWEFLRRNRFYQAVVDEHMESLPDSQWGYKWHENVARGHGLVRYKPYWEAYMEDEPPAWKGLDSFAERLPTKVDLTPSSVTIALEPGQVAVVFDVAGLIQGQSPWNIQAWALHERLSELCNTQLETQEVGGKPPHKKVLLRRLKMFDLLSEGWPIDEAAKKLHYRQKRTPKQVAQAASPFSPMHLQLGKSEPVTTAYDDANTAYDLVYRHGYLGLLQGEKNYTLNGNRLVSNTLVYKNWDGEGEPVW